MEIVSHNRGKNKGGGPTKSTPLDDKIEAASAQPVFIRYNVAEQKKRFKAWVKQYNSRQIYLKDKIRGNIAQTFCELLRLNAIKVSRYQEGESLPCLYSTNVELSKETGWSQRTIRQHISCLVKLGILYKRFRGTNAPYALWINSWILTGSGPLPTPATPSFFTSKGPISPHTLSNNYYNFYNRACGFVYKPGPKGGNSSEEHDEQPQKGVYLKNMMNNFLMNKGGQDTLNSEPLLNKAGGAGPGQEPADNLPPTQDKILAQIIAKAEKEDSEQLVFQPQDKGGQDKPGNSAPRTTQRKAESGLSPSERRAQNYTYYLSLVTLFWEYTKQRLYPEFRFNAEQEKQYKTQIFKQVYRGFPASWSRKEWDQYHSSIIERIDIAARYRRKYPRWFVALPEKFFNPQFSQGFSKTYQWWCQNQAAQKRQKVKDELAKARQSISAKMLPESVLMQDSLSQLYNYWKQRIHKLGDPEAEAALEAIFASQYNLSLNL